MGTALVRFSAKAWENFQLCFTLVGVSGRKIGAHPGSDNISPKKAFRHLNDDFLE